MAQLYPENQAQWQGLHHLWLGPLLPHQMEEWQPSPCATFSPTWHQRFSLFFYIFISSATRNGIIPGVRFWHFWKVSVSHLPRAKALWLHDTLDIFEYHMTGNARNPLHQIPQLSSLKSTYCVELDEDSCFGQCLGQRKDVVSPGSFWEGLNFFQPVSQYHFRWWEVK